MSDRLARRHFLGALALVATAAPLALALPRASDAAGAVDAAGVWLGAGGGGGGAAALTCSVVGAAGADADD